MNRYYLIPLLILCIAGESEGNKYRKSKDLDSTQDKADQYESVQRLIKNPTLASGFTSGAKSINRTVDTLMESLFYSVMDQTVSTKFTHDLGFDIGYSRNVNETNFGTYIITDSFRLGPSYQKKLLSIGTIPATLSGNGNAIVSNIYHRSDALRAYENNTLPLWRGVFNQWFGMLPVLTNILPPSFNPEELYDPLKYLSTPFLIPNTAEQAKKIPIGSIRRYGINGGINLAADPFFDSFKKITDETSLDDLDIALPISVFKTGSHTISILRKSEHIFWLFVSDVRSNGTKIESLLSSSLRIFTKLVPQWAGIKAPFKPIDVLFSKAKVSSIEQLYTFDFRYPSARNSFKKAVSGDFTASYKSSKRGQDKGVSFEFMKVKYADEKGTQTERNFFVQQSKHASQISSAHVEIEDRRKKINLLEVEQLWENLDWNVLVGAETLKVNNRVEIKVKKAPNHSRHNPSFVFDPKEKAPINIFSSLSITDKFTDALEFRHTIELLKYYLTLPLSGVPNIPVYAQDRVTEQKLLHTLSNPMEDIQRINITPIYLGKSTINAHVSFPSSYLKQMSMKKPFQIRRSMALAYQVDATYWSNRNIRERWSWLFKYFRWAAMQPLKLLTISVPEYEFIRETKRTVDALQLLRRATNPTEHLEAYRNLFDSAYPIQLVRALSLLGDYRRLPRYVSFSSSPKHKSKDSQDTKRAKDLFASINHKIIRSSPRFPKSFTFKTIDRKIAAFNPSNFIDDRPKPKLRKIFISPEKNGDSYRYKVKLLLEPTRRRQKKAYIYVKLEQSGSVDFGRFVLIDRTVQIPLKRYSSKKRPLNQLEFYLNGEKSPFNSTFTNFVLNLGGEFNLSLSASEDSRAWSDAKFVKIGLNDRTVEFL